MASSLSGLGMNSMISPSRNWTKGYLICCFLRAADLIMKEAVSEGSAPRAKAMESVPFGLNAAMLSMYLKTRRILGWMRKMDTTD